MAADDGAQQKKGLPMDAMLEIAAGTDPVTVVRLAATCKDLRRYIGEPSSFCRRRLRLRLRRGERLGRSVLGGQLVVGKWGNDLYVEDRACNLIATGCFHHDVKEKEPVPIAARDGLVLVRVHNPWQPDARAAVDLRVCSPSTGRVQSLPPGPEFKGRFVLLVGDGEGGGAVGRPFKVLNVTTVVEAGFEHRNGTCPRRHLFQFQTFSSERGTWGRRTRRISPTGRHCSLLPPLPGRHLVLGDAVHWLNREHRFGRYYALKLHVGDDKQAWLRLTSTILPPSFFHECEYPRLGPQQILVAATEAGSPVVLVANNGRISAWTMSENGKGWTNKPHVVVDYEAMRRFGNVQESSDLGIVQLEWFAERSGVVQVSTQRCGFFWLHLQSKKIIRHFQGSLYTRSCPYEIDLSSWVGAHGS